MVKFSYQITEMISSSDSSVAAMIMGHSGHILDYLTENNIKYNLSIVTNVGRSAYYVFHSVKLTEEEATYITLMFPNVTIKQEDMYN